MRILALPLLAIAIFLAFALSVGADSTVTFTQGGSAPINYSDNVYDSMMYGCCGLADNNYGTSTEMVCSAETGDNTGCVLKFNMSKITTDLGCDTIEEANLTVKIKNVAGLGGRNWEAHNLILHNYTETGVTWNEYDGANNWTPAAWNDGVGNAEYNGTAESYVTPAAAGNFTFNVTEITQFNINNGNLGILLTWEAAAGGDRVDIHSSEAASEQDRPRLTVRCSETPPPVAPNSTLDILFTNLSGQPETVFDEGQNFIIRGNLTHTSNGTAIANATCLLNVTDGIIEEHASDDNFTICTVGCDNATYTNEFINTPATANSSTDYIHFNICHAQTTIKPALVTVSCSGASNLTTIEAVDFPLCSVGSASIFLDRTTCIASDHVNVTITNTAPLSQRHVIDSLALDREFTDDISPMTYNATSKLYETDHSHEFYEHGTQDIKIECSEIGTLNKNKSEQITIENAPPFIFFSQVTAVLQGLTFNLTENISLEYYNGTYNWSIEAVDDDLTTVNVTFYNDTTKIYSQNQTGNADIETTASLFVNYFTNEIVITVIANDSNGDSTTQSLNITFVDTGNPTANGIFNTSVLVNESVSFEVNFSDENFFSINMSCTNGFENVSTGLNVQNYTFLPIWNGSTAYNRTHNCTWTYCDGHTANKLNKDWNMITAGEYLYFQVGGGQNAIHVPNITGTGYQWEKKHDRVSFEIDFNYAGDMVYNDWKTIYYHTSPSAYYFPSNKYDAWIVDDASKTWFDLNGIGAESFKVKQLNSTLWEIKIKTNKDKIKADSIGELNCVSEQSSIVVLRAHVDIFALFQCPNDTQSDVFMFFFIFLMLVAMTMLNWLIIRLPILHVIIGLGYIFFSFYLLGCLFVVGSVMFMFGIAMFGLAFTMNKNVTMAG